MSTTREPPTLARPPHAARSVAPRRPPLRRPSSPSLGFRRPEIGCITLHADRLVATRSDAPRSRQPLHLVTVAATAA
jgi:hypothetical protein